jgi:hypothetical protein
MKFLFHIWHFIFHILNLHIWKTRYAWNFDFTYEIIYFIYELCEIDYLYRGGEWQSFPHSLSIFRLKDLCVSQLTRKLSIFNLFLNFYKVQICYPWY